MPSSHDIEPVARAYPVDYSPTRIKPLRSAGGMSGAQFWRLDSPRGMLALRRWPDEHPTRQRLQFIHSVLLHAAERGVKFLALPIRTIVGDTFVTHDGSLWDLAPWMPGVADYEQAPSEQKLRAAMAALAKFHLAVADFPIPTNRLAAGPPPAVARHLTTLHDLENGQIESLARAIKHLPWPEFAQMAQIFIGKLPESVPRAIERLLPLASSPLPVQPCLRDIWHDHVLFAGNEVSGIIDYGATDFDTPSTDLARLLGSLAGDDGPGWNFGLQAYSAVRPLRTEERTAAIALDASGTILAGCNWIRWISIERRQFENPAQVLNRFRRITLRLSAAGR